MSLEYGLLSPDAVVGMFFQNYAASVTPSDYEGIARELRSSSLTTKYPVLGGVKGFTEIKAGGGTSIQKLTEHEIVVTSKEFDNSFQAHILTMKMEAAEQVNQAVGSFVSEAKMIGYELVDDLLLNGESTACYDGQYFYDTDHPAGAYGNQSNIVSVDISALPVEVHGSTTLPSKEELQQAVVQGVQGLMKIKSPTGKQANRGASKFKVTLPIGLWGVMFSGVQLPAVGQPAVQVVSAMGNFQITYHVNFNLSAWSDKFVITRTDEPTAAFIIQPVVDPLFVYAEQPNAENGWNHRWDCYTVVGANYARWERSVMVKLI